jgi:hypothetical protein
MRIQARISGHKMRRALRPARTPTCLNATPVSHMDVWPTTAAMVGLTPPPQGFHRRCNGGYMRFAGARLKVSRLERCPKQEANNNKHQHQ